MLIIPVLAAMLTDAGEASGRRALEVRGRLGLAERRAVGGLRGRLRWVARQWSAGVARSVAVVLAQAGELRLAPKVEGGAVDLTAALHALLNDRDFEAALSVVSADPSRVDGLVAWLGQRLVAGEVVVDVKLPWMDRQRGMVNGRMAAQLLGHVVDWARETSPNLGGVTFLAAIERSDRWHEQHALELQEVALSAQASRAPVVTSWPDGARVVRLVTAEQLRWEAQQMRHCVDTWADDVRSGQVAVFSYRNPAGRPRATWALMTPDSALASSIGSRVLDFEGFANMEVTDPVAAARALAWLVRRGGASWRATPAVLEAAGRPGSWRLAIDEDARTDAPRRRASRDPSAPGAAAARYQAARRDRRAAQARARDWATDRRRVEDTAAFLRWSGGLPVVDAGEEIPSGGAVVRAFHATNSDVEQFRPFSHFGTEKAANDRYEDLRSFSENVIGRDPGPFSVAAVYLRLACPLDMPDLAGLYLAEDGEFLTLEEAEADLSRFYQDDDDDPQLPSPCSWESETDLSEWLSANDLIDSDEFWDVQYDPAAAMRLLQAKGYDGIVYDNVVEDAGSRSYIVFEPSQVKSATGNRGAFDPADPRITYGAAGGRPDLRALVELEARALEPLLGGGRISASVRRDEEVDLGDRPMLLDWSDDDLEAWLVSDATGDEVAVLVYRDAGDVGSSGWWVDSIVPVPHRSRQLHESPAEALVGAGVALFRGEWDRRFDAGEDQLAARVDLMPHERFLQALRWGGRGASPRAVTYRAAASPGKLIGWRVMRYDLRRGSAISGADSRVSVPLRVGEVHAPSGPGGAGFWLGSTRQYVLDHYAVHDMNALLCYEFDPDLVQSGSITDAEPEISVREGKLVGVQVLDEDLAEIPPEMLRELRGDLGAP